MLCFLAKRHGKTRKLAQAMGANVGRSGDAVSERERVSAGLALRAAKVASVALSGGVALYPTPTRKRSRSV